MYQHSTSSYKYVSLDLTHLNQKKKSARQALIQHRDYGLTYGQDFSIQNTWVSNNKGDAIKESMLGYSKRMSDIRRIRGINALRNSTNSSSSSSMFINMAKGSFQLDMDENSRRYFAAHNRMSKSLGNIKLEPLLGSRKISANIDNDSSTSLQTHRVEKTVPQLIEEPVKVRHITVTITIPPPEVQEEEEEPNEALPELQPELPTSPLESGETVKLPGRKKLVPLGSGRARPRKAKRMKITGPALESIEEDSENQSHVQEMEEGYNDLLNDVHDSHELMLEQKRRTVALLRQTNYAQRSHQQNRQQAMATLAKRKLKRLPPIPTGRPSFRYTNSRAGINRSPYSEEARTRE